MSKGRTKYAQSDMALIRKELHLGTPKKNEISYDEKRRTAQRIKFCRCSVCGGMMTFVPMSNTLFCNNVVTKEKIKKNKDNVEIKYTVDEPCGNINLVGEEFVGYLNYLFDGVPADQAVIDATKKATVKKVTVKEEN